MPSVSATDGKADVGVLGSQPGLSPHSPEGEEDPGQDVGVPRHQTVTVERETASSAETYHRHWPRHHFTLTDRRKKERKKEEAANNGTKSPDKGEMSDNGRGNQKMRGGRFITPGEVCSPAEGGNECSCGAFCES